MRVNPLRSASETIVRFTRVVGLALLSLGLLQTEELGLAQAKPAGVSSAGSETRSSTESAITTKIREALAVGTLVEADNGLVLEGTARFLGNDCQFRLAFDAQGRFIQEISGPVSITVGFDGTTAWERDWNETPRVLELGDRDDALLNTWMVTGQWLLPEIDLEILSSKSTGGFSSLTIRVGDGPLVGTLLVDEESWIPKSFSYERLREWEVTMADFSSYDGMLFPGTISSISSSGDEAIFHVESVNPNASGAAWEAQLESPEDYSFDSTVAARLHVKRAPTGHILVKPVVDQKEVGWFIFDTGAGASAIDTALALELGLKPSGSLSVGGIGGDVETSVFRAASFHLGPLTVQNSFLIGTDLKPISQLLGTEIAGIIGYNILARSVVEFNRLDAKVALFDPDRYERKDLEWNTLILYNRIAHLRGSLEGHEGVFVLDTGSGGSLIVHQPAVAGLKLLSGRATQPTTLRGVGGTLPALQGSVSKLDFAGYHLEDVSTKFATIRKGVLGDPYTLGNIGGSILECITLVMDYSNRRIALFGMESI